MVSAIKIGSSGKISTEKDPDAVLDYPFDWTPWLDDSADTILSVSFVTTGGLVVDSHTFTDKMVIAWVSGGTVRKRATVTCRINTVGGRTEDRTLHFTIKEK